MCSEKEPKGSMKKVTLIMPDGSEVGPVKVSGKIRQTGELMEATVYAGQSVLANSLPSIQRFMAVYTNFDNRKGPQRDK